MNLLRKFQAGRYARRLQASGVLSPDDVEEARAELIAIGPAAIAAVLASVARGRADDASVGVLAHLLSDGTFPALADALHSPVPAVADAAAAALARSEGYHPRLLLALFADARIVKSRLERVLGAQLPRLKAATLVRELPELPREARGGVFRLLEHSDDPAIVTECLPLMANHDWWLRLHAVKLIARFPEPDAIVGVCRVLTDKNPAVRLEAVRALATMRAVDALPALCGRLRDPDVRVQTAAIESLILLGDVAAVPLLLEYLKDDAEQVRRGAVEVLNQVVTPDAIKDLVEALRDSDWWVRVRAADALGSLGGPRVIDAVIGLAKDPDEYVRRYAIEILNMVPDARAVDVLIDALGDADWWVRERAIDALAKTGDSRAVEPLLAILGSDSRSVPLCVKALANLPDPRAVEPLCTLAEGADPELRAEALVALQRYAVASLPEDRKSRVLETLERAGVAAFSESGAPGTPGPHAPFGPETERPTSAHPAPQGAPEPRIEPGLDVRNLEPGTVLGRRFRILERIGGGGFGTVYRAEDVIVHEELVLKVLSTHLSLDESMIRRFVQELRLSRRITHRNVIRIHDLLDLNGAHAISMEYFSGRDLGQELRDHGPMPLPRLLGIARQILEGLAAAHEIGIIHRDIKPGNVLIGEGDLVKIVDFGLASVGQSGRSRLTQSGILVGTPEYISPEQITGQEVDGRTDLYSFGVVLWELATGRQPFAGETAVNVLFQHLEPDVPHLKEVRPDTPDAVDAFVMSCMARFAADRPANARDALVMLDRAA